MFKKLWKNREEFWILVGNVAVLIFFLVSFIFFLRFTVRIVTQATNLSISGTGPAKELRKDDLEKIQILLRRTGGGFSLLGTPAVGSSSTPASASN